MANVCVSVGVLMKNRKKGVMWTGVLSFSPLFIYMGIGYVVVKLVATLHLSVTVTSCWVRGKESRKGRLMNNLTGLC